MHTKKVLIIKRMVGDLLSLYGDSMEPIEAIDRLRDLVERGIGNFDIPLEVYEWNDGAFLRYVQPQEEVRESK